MPIVTMTLEGQNPEGGGRGGRKKKNLGCTREPTKRGREATLKSEPQVV